MKIKNTILFSLIATFFLIFLVSIWKVLATLQGLTIKTFNIEIIFIIGFLISLFHLIFNWNYIKLDVLFVSFLSECVKERDSVCVYENDE